MPVAAMRAGGVFPASRFDHEGIVAVAGAATPVVYGPADTRPALHAMAEQAGGSGALDAGHLAALLGPRASRVLGPAWYGYATRDSLLAPRGTTVRRGLAHAVVAAAAREGLNGRPVVQYRARRANTASLAVAARTGFTHYADGLVIHLSA